MDTSRGTAPVLLEVPDEEEKERTRITPEVTAALRALEDKTGQLLPESVVRAAEHKASPLHAFFDWDDKSAAWSWRIEEARRLIRRVRVEVQTTEVSLRVPAYVRTPDATAASPGYSRLDTIAEGRKALVKEALVRDELERILLLVRRSALVCARALPASADDFKRLTATVERILSKYDR